MEQINELGPRIESYFKTLTKSEAKVARLVLEQMDKVLSMSITDLAEQAGVGETTVIRFCRKLGFRGYQEFRMAVAKATVNPLSNLHRDIEENDELQIMVQKITMSNIQVLQETMGLIDLQQLEKAIEFILSQKRLYFFGVGVSGITAQDAKSKFLRIGFHAEAVIDSHFQAMLASTLSDQDLVIGLSVSGSTKDVVDALRIAKENGAKIIAITHFARSPITKISDVVLLTGGRETPLQGGSMAAKMAQLLALDMLFTGAAIRIKERALRYIEKTAQSVVDKAY